MHAHTHTLSLLAFLSLPLFALSSLPLYLSPPLTSSLSLARFFQACTNATPPSVFQEVDALEESNASMRKIVAELEAEKAKLKRLLSFHDDLGPKCPKRQRLSEEHEEPEREEELLEVLMDAETFDEDAQVVIN
jgi:hypothetical protein